MSRLLIGFAGGVVLAIVAFLFDTSTWATVISAMIGVATWEIANGYDN